MKRPSCCGDINTSKKIKSKTTNSKSIDDKPVKVVYISNPMRVTTSAATFRSLVQKLTGRDSNLAVAAQKQQQQQQQQQQKMKQQPAEHIAAAVASPSSACEKVFAAASNLSSSDPAAAASDFAYDRFLISGGKGESSYNNNDHRDWTEIAASTLQLEGLNELAFGAPMHVALEGFAAGIVSSHLY